MCSNHRPSEKKNLKTCDSGLKKACCLPPPQVLASPPDLRRFPHPPPVRLPVDARWQRAVGPRGTILGAVQDGRDGVGTVGAQLPGGRLAGMLLTREMPPINPKP